MRSAAIYRHMVLWPFLYFDEMGRLSGVSMKEGLDGGGLVFTIPQKFSPLFISLKLWVIH